MLDPIYCKVSKGKVIFTCFDEERDLQLEIVLPIVPLAKMELILIEFFFTI